MRIIIPSFEEIKLMPPTITLFHTLAEMGYEVIYVTIFPDEYASNFSEENITNIPLVKKNFTIKHNYHIPDIFGIRGFVFRIDNIIKSYFAHKLKRWLKNNLKEDDLLWVVNEMTPILAGSSFTNKYKDKYIFTIYELHNAIRATRNIKRTAQNAKITVVPEYNRAHIQKYFFNLQRLPLILPNKPLDSFEGRKMPIADNEIMDKISKINKSGKKIVLYMGIIGRERPLEKIIRAVRKHKDKYELVILGRPSTYLNYLSEQYNGDFTYLGFVTPPQHINVASHADIGILIYEPQGNIGLNALYCAPNKIYEYTGLGLPVLTNDIPGLYNIVKSYECGLSIDMNDEDSISENLSKLIDNYDKYQQGANRFYKSVNVREIIGNIIEEAIKTQ